MTSLSATILPDDTIWEDEFKWSEVQQSISRTAGGRAVVQYGKIQGARPVTLTCHWLSKQVVDELVSLRDTAGAIMSLVLADGRTLSVMFRHQDREPIKADPVIDYPTYAASDLFDVTLKLMEI